jgi:hypothetical protein
VRILSSIECGVSILRTESVPILMVLVGVFFAVFDARCGAHDIRRKYAKEDETLPIDVLTTVAPPTNVLYV